MYDYVQAYLMRKTVSVERVNSVELKWMWVAYFYRTQKFKGGIHECDQSIR